jgi:hypothetical protein
MKKILKKIRSLFSVIAFTLIFLAIVITNLVNLSSEEIMIDIQQKLPKHSVESFPVIKSYTNASIKGDHILVLKENKLLLKFVAPKNEWMMDNLYALAFFICGIIIIYFFWNYNKEKPFAGRLSICLDNIGTILLLTWMFNSVRTHLFNKQVLALTNNDYMYKSGAFEQPEFWISIILLRLAYVMKKGEKLQLEQDLTV